MEDKQKILDLLLPALQACDSGTALIRDVIGQII